jgi:hypothetical protein
MKTNLLLTYSTIGVAFAVACSAGPANQSAWWSTPTDDSAGPVPAVRGDGGGAADTGQVITPPASNASGDAASAGPPTPPVNKALPDAATAPTPSHDDAGGKGSGAFDAGAGVLQSDGNTVAFHIAPGTGNKDWNSSNNPIRVKRGMVIKIVDDDPNAMPAHSMHTFGQPCPHPLGTVSAGGNQCVVSQTAPMGIQQGVFDHNGGLIFIEIVPN